MKKYLLLCLFSLNVSAADIPASVRESLREAGIPESAASIFVQDVANKEPLLAWEADKAMNPASTMKLLSAYAALDILGPAYTWKTESYVSGKIQDGILEGNLILKGYGDPKLTLENFWLLLRDLRQRGLRKIKGDVIFDRSHFAVEKTDPGSFDNQPYKAYNVLPDALLVNFQATQIKFIPERNAVRIVAEPDLGNLSIENRIVLTEGPCNGWSDKIKSAVSVSGKNAKLFLSGTFSSRCGEKSDELALFDHSTYLFELFKSLWRELGGEVDGSWRDAPLPDNARLFAAFNSPPLASILVDINKYSNNVMARQVFLTLSSQSGQSGSVGNSAKIVQGWLENKGLDFPELVLENGAGLSRIARISARHMGMLLLEAHRSAYEPEFTASLPIIGIDGTMKKRLADSPVAGHAHVKSGSLEGVRAIAGFVHGKKNIVVVCLINHPNAAKSKPAIDNLLKWAEDL